MISTDEIVVEEETMGREHASMLSLIYTTGSQGLLALATLALPITTTFS